MKILFWNVGEKLKPNQLQLIEELILEKKPNIVCIAEGAKSKKDCEILVSLIENLGFDSFYNPLFNKKLNLNFPFHNVCLKVFTKQNLQKKPATDRNIAEKGRIINLEINDYKVFFVHALSMLNEDFDVSDFYKDLYDRLNGQQNNKKIIIGDFNIEPWHKLLQREKKIHSFFYKKAMKFHRERILESSVGKKIFYYNPFLEHIQQHGEDLLIGTYYNPAENNYYAKIIDFALFSDEISNDDYKVEVVTTIQQKTLLIKEEGKTSIMSGFDHLPIIIQLK